MGQYETKTRFDSRAQMFDEALASLRGLDVLVNNAGIAGPTANAEDISAADWEEVLRVNLVGPFLCCRAVIPEMKERRRGG